FILDSKTPTLPLRDFYQKENRFSAVQADNAWLDDVQNAISKRYALYQKLTALFEETNGE
ncbi:MAG: hypothetical protein IKA40_03310, partial [Clostridia bacterium]|nr:hypothetical protein [Clostridia bacterium]